MKKTVIPYILAGYPNLQTTEELLVFCDSIGISHVELGIPFSDPSSDGPVIQEAALKASASFSFAELLKVLQKHKFNLEITIMTYANPLYVYGIDKFFKSFQNTSVKGLLVPDIPFIEHKLISKKSSIKNVWMISENLPKKQLDEIVLNSEYYLYLVSYLGTTGKDISNTDKIAKVVKKVKAIKNIDVAVGFGIKNKANVQDILKVADGAIVGTSIITELDKGLGNAKAFIKNLL
jgi:tryptophan synthase alpha chain